MTDPLKTRIRSRLDEIGKTARAASLEAGLHPDTIRNVLRERSKKPRGDSLVKLAHALDCSVEWLMEGVTPLPASSSAPPPPRTPLSDKDADRNSPAAPAAMPRNIPVLGTAAGSLKGAFQVDANPIDYVRRPPGLEGTRDVYALYIVGSSMSPRYEEGELIYVSQRRPARIGDYVVVQTADPQDGTVSAYCKRLIRRDADTLVMEQLNPATTITLNMAEVIAVHRILTLNELFGA